MKLSTLILAVSLCTAAVACVPVENCPGQVDCFPNSGFDQQDYCCPNGSYCVTAVSPPVCVTGYGADATRIPAAESANKPEAGTTK